MSTLKYHDGVSWKYLPLSGPAGPSTVPIEDWHNIGAAGEPAFQGTWVANGTQPSYNPPGFRKRPDGVVELRGSVKSGTLNTTVFTLPVGYRPVNGIRISTQAHNGTAVVAGMIYVDAATGNVQIYGSTNADCGLEDVEFSTDQATYPTGPKGDKGDVGGTMGAAFGASPGFTTTGIANGTWTLALIPAAFVSSPVDAFTRNANGSITINQSGLYAFDAVVLPGEAKTAGLIFETRICKKAGGLPAISDMFTVDDTNGAVANNYASTNPTGVIECAAGDIVAIYTYLATTPAVTHSANLMRFSITRQGGPAGQMEVYTQPTQPSSVNPGAIWIDTDESPSNGNVPPGGTVGQIITKTGAADFVAGWANPAVSGITGQTYTMSGYIADRVMNAGAMTLGEVAAVLATLIDDMKAAGLIKP